MIKQIFFDLDGVLTTDRTGSVTICKYFADKLNVDFQELFESKKRFDEQIDNGSLSDMKVWETACQEAGIKFHSHWLQEAYVSAPIDHKMVQYAKQWKGKYDIGIITDNSVNRVNAMIEKNNWQGIFDVVIISEEVKTTKKKTKIFEIAAQRADVNAEECILIDNSQGNADTAQQAGFTGIYFDDTVRDYEELSKNCTEDRSAPHPQP